MPRYHPYRSSSDFLPSARPLAAGLRAAPRLTAVHALTSGCPQFGVPCLLLSLTSAVVTTNESSPARNCSLLPHVGSDRNLKKEGERRRQENAKASGDAIFAGMRARALSVGTHFEFDRWKRRLLCG